jgi:hypothetical protein
MVMSGNKVQIDVESLAALGSLAIANGTSDRFIPLVLQWANAANAELVRLKGEVESKQARIDELMKGLS